MIARRRTARIAQQLNGRWLRPQASLVIQIADVSAHGLFVSERTDMPIGQLQQIEVDLPLATVRLLVVPRHATKTAWTHGLGMEIFALSALDRNLWMASFNAFREPQQAPRARSVDAAR